MRIGLISDTHIPEVSEALPREVEKAFANVDLILHAGDIFVISVLDELERLAPVLVSSGDGEYFYRDRRAKMIHILNVDGLTLWLTHFRPYIQDPDSKRDSEPITRRCETKPDIIVFGHTHKAMVKSHSGILEVNPGSATFPDYKPELGTVAILTVSSGKANVQILQLG